MSKDKRILIWDSSICDLLNNRSFGGIAVQLYFWAQIFSQQGWNVFALTTHSAYCKGFIDFRHIKHFRGVDIIVEWFYILYYFLKIRPDIVIVRGAKRHVFPLALCGRLLQVKVVLFGASDVNFTPGKELCGNNINSAIYRMGVSQLKYIITQNSFQTRTLLANYGKFSLQLFNIWGTTEDLKPKDFRQQKYDIVWIANFRRLKRPEWFIHLTERLQDFSFAIAGGPMGDDVYYKNMKNRMEQTKNGSFLGSIPFYASNELARSAKILVCTSEFEGFPNTFLQAWSGNVPVVSTVDPSGIIKKYNLGMVVSNEDELLQAVERILNDANLYALMQANIKAFFEENHSAISGYKKLLNYIN